MTGACIASARNLREVIKRRVAEKLREERD